MPLRLDVKRRLTARSDRVKSVDLHPTEPWMLASLYNGNVHVWNIDSQQLVKSFEVCDSPVRTSKFVARKNWIVTGSDDMQIRVFNYNTLERVHQYEAHSDYIRCIAVHPSQSFILTSSDDMTIKLWNWEKKWACQQVFEGHSHYVMQIVINPKDNNTFASASLDRSVKVWQLGSPQPNFTLDGHQRGVNCVDYYHGGDKPYLISGADDNMVKIWDYQNKTCVQTLEGHSQNISSVCFHPELPIIITGSEDCTIRIWHANTYRLENTLNYGLDRVWFISTMKGSNNVAFGYDEGSVMVKLGREEPAMSMDVSGKIVWAKHSEIQQANLKAMGDTDIMDGERLPLAVKDLGACDIYPQTIAHNPNGRFVVVCGDGEYIIYTAMALRNKAFGSALEFVWALDSSEYAIRDSPFAIKLFKNFKEKKTFKPDFACDGIFGGHLLGVKSAAGLSFYDWETTELLRRIEIQPRQVFWSESGEYVCIATDDNYFILKYNAEAIAAAKDNKESVSEDGIEEGFDLVDEVQEVVKTGKWVGDCFIYTNSVNRLNYYVGGEIVTIAHLDRTLYLLGYISKDNRLYLGDKELNVVSYELLLSVLEYQTAVMRRDFETADRVLPTIPLTHRTRVAHFLEKQGFKKQALAVSSDPEHKFDLALNLGELDMCHQLATEAGSKHKWRQVADLAEQVGNLDMAQKCLLKAHDYPGLLLQATASGNSSLVKEVGQEAEVQGRNNVAFLSYFITGQLKSCLELLINTNRVPEAAFFARTYMPSEMPRVVELWKQKVGEKMGQSLANPAQYDNLFPGLGDALKTEQFLNSQRERPVPAAAASSLPSNHERNPLEEMHAAEASGIFDYSPPKLDKEDSEFVDAPSDPSSVEGGHGMDALSARLQEQQLSDSPSVKDSPRSNVQEPADPPDGSEIQEQKTAHLTSVDNLSMNKSDSLNLASNMENLSQIRSQSNDWFSGTFLKKIEQASNLMQNILPMPVDTIQNSKVSDCANLPSNLDSSAPAIKNELNNTTVQESVNLHKIDDMSKDFTDKESEESPKSIAENTLEPFTINNDEVGNELNQSSIKILNENILNRNDKPPIGVDLNEQNKEKYEPSQLFEGFNIGNKDGNSPCKKVDEICDLNVNSISGIQMPCSINDTMEFNKELEENEDDFDNFSPSEEYSINVSNSLDNIPIDDKNVKSDLLKSHEVRSQDEDFMFIEKASKEDILDKFFGAMNTDIKYDSEGLMEDSIDVEGKIIEKNDHGIQSFSDLDPSPFNTIKENPIIPDFKIPSSPKHEIKLSNFLFDEERNELKSNLNLTNNLQFDLNEGSMNLFSQPNSNKLDSPRSSNLGMNQELLNVASAEANIPSSLFDNSLKNKDRIPNIGDDFGDFSFDFKPCANADNTSSVNLMGKEELPFCSTNRGINKDLLLNDDVPCVSSNRNSTNTSLTKSNGSDLKNDPQTMNPANVIQGFDMQYFSEDTSDQYEINFDQSPNSSQRPLKVDFSHGLDNSNKLDLERGSNGGGLISSASSSDYRFNSTSEFAANHGKVFNPFLISDDDDFGNNLIGEKMEDVNKPKIDESSKPPIEDMGFDDGWGDDVDNDNNDIDDNDVEDNLDDYDDDDEESSKSSDAPLAATSDDKSKNVFDQAQLERELELDLEKVRIDDEDIDDINDVNIEDSLLED